MVIVLETACDGLLPARKDCIITEVPICMLWWLREGHFELEFHVGHQSLHIAWFGLMLKLMLLCVTAIVSPCIYLPCQSGL